MTTWNPTRGLCNRHYSPRCTVVPVAYGFKFWGPDLMNRRVSSSPTTQAGDHGDWEPGPRAGGAAERELPDGKSSIPRSYKQIHQRTRRVGIWHMIDGEERNGGRTGRRPSGHRVSEQHPTSRRPGGRSRCSFGEAWQRPEWQCHTNYEVWQFPGVPQRPRSAAKLL